MTRTLIYRNILDEQDFVALQNDLNLIVQWSIDWQMSFNPNKSEFLRIRNKVNYISPDYSLKDCQIPLVSHAKYLGVIIDKHLNWTVNMITAKANSVRRFLQCNLCKFHIVMLKALPTLLMFTPYWTMRVVMCGDHTISIIFQELRWFKKEQQAF